METVYLEYDRYQDDKYGGIWHGVDLSVKKFGFLPAEYMHKSGSVTRRVLGKPNRMQAGKTG
jgi:hypothetical protein